MLCSHAGWPYAGEALHSQLRQWCAWASQGREREDSMCLLSLALWSHPPKKHVELRKGFNYGDMEAHDYKTLAFNAFKDPCPSLTKEQVELCKGFD